MNNTTGTIQTIAFVNGVAQFSPVKETNKERHIENFKKVFGGDKPPHGIRWQIAHGNDGGFVSKVWRGGKIYCVQTYFPFI